MVCKHLFYDCDFIGDSNSHFVSHCVSLSFLLAPVNFAVRLFLTSVVILGLA